jgi:Holliday junction resolvase RusA-like endonuclease
MAKYVFTIYGPPVGKERARTYTADGKTRTITPDKTREFERQVGLHAFAAGMREPREKKLWAVRLLVYKATKNEALWHTICDSTPDGDNVEKAVWDGLKPYLGDDKDVGIWNGSKLWCKPGQEGVRVWVMEIDKHGGEI